MEKIRADYYTDVLCIWAYAAIPRLEALRRDFPEQVEVRLRYLPIFGATHQRIVGTQKEDSAFHAFHAHLQEVAKAWPHVQLHPAIWKEVRPASSLTAHLYLKAAQAQTDAFSELFDLDNRIRHAFFTEGRGIGRREVLDELVADAGLDVAAIHDRIDSGEAGAALCADMKDKEEQAIPGSPTLVLNEGRQRLYGNVGYRVMEANVRELLHNPAAGEASWC